MQETWRPIPGFGDRYEVSAEGNVRRVLHQPLKPIRMKGNYQRVTLSNGPQDTGFRAVHRLVAHAFIGPCPAGYVVNHKDGDPSNNRVENLEYVTQHENVLDSWRRGRQPAHRGMTTHFAKLTDNDVIQIRRLRSEGVTYSAIAAQFNTKPANVWHICIGRTWKHLLQRLPPPESV